MSSFDSIFPSFSYLLLLFALFLSFSLSLYPSAFIPLFITNLYKCKPINTIAAEQVKDSTCLRLLPSLSLPLIL